MKKYIISMAAALILLTFSITIATGVRYPAYTLLEDYGTEIQNMVMGQVVGDSLKIDLISDALGLILLGITCIGILAMNKKEQKKARAEEGSPEELRAQGFHSKVEFLQKANKTLVHGIVWSGLGFVLYLVRMFLPFMISGAGLYGVEYAIHFMVAGAISLAMFNTVFGFSELCETVENHKNNILVEIWAILTAICSFIYNMGDFYQLTAVAWIYKCVQVLFLLLTLICLFRGLKYLYTNERQEIQNSDKE